LSKRPYVIFGLFALLFAIAIPAWAISREGGESASPESVPSSLDEGKQLFVTNCGACHTLAKAGTDGIIGPDLDDQLAPAGPPPSPESIKPRVLTAIMNGFDTQDANRMPPGILSGPDADAVADFVSQVAGRP
jgi:mono/diheme cytochrome c family protein